MLTGDSQDSPGHGKCAERLGQAAKPGLFCCSFLDLPRHSRGPLLPGEGAWRSLSFAFASLFERCRSGLRQTDRGAPFLGAVWCRECYGALSFCALRGHIGALDDDVKGEVAMQRVHEVVVAQRARVSRCDAS